jgi:hypothetical protein
MSTQTMDAFTYVLLSLLRLSTPPYAARGGVTPAPLRDMLAAALPEIAGEQGQNLLNAILSHGDVNSSSPNTETMSIYRMLEQIERGMHDCLPSDQTLSKTSQTIDEAVAIALNSRVRSITHTSVFIDNLAVFDYLSTIVIEPQPGDPIVVLVGKVPNSLGRLLVTVPGRQLQLRKTQFDYISGSAYPHLNVYLPSVYGETELQINRTGWVQHEDAHLDLYNHDMRSFGQISTSRATPPFYVEGARISVAISEAANATLLVTHILDGGGRELAQVVKVVST